MTFTTRPELAGTFGMVASTHWIASAVGMGILERGGNAFDAAVAAGFALQVVEPHLNGPGGEVPVILYSRERDEVIVVDGQGVAPGGATISVFRARGDELIPGTGVTAACVPGAFGAWLLVLGEFGTMPLRDVLAPAIELAGGGFPLVPKISSTIEAVADVFREEWPSSADIYLRDGLPGAGTRFRNPDLAASYERILGEAESAGADREEQIEAARVAFYEGFVAEAIDGFVREADGFLTGEDLAKWHASMEAPVRGAWETPSAGVTSAVYEVCKCGPWTQGPVFLQQLELVAGVDLASMGHATTEYIHTVVEGAKLAFADREFFYGDPRFADVPLDDLLSGEYADIRRRLIERDASLELRPGGPGGRIGVAPPATLVGDVAPAHLRGVGEPTRGDTCHVDVVDRSGNMVAATPSGGWLQSSPVVPGLGFPLGTRMQMFWLNADHPAGLAPGKRPRTTLTPSLALRDGEPYLAFGTPGGDTQDQWSFNFFLNHVVFGMDLQAAMDAPMFHTNHFPSSFFPRAAAPGQIEVEGRVDAEVIDELRRRGHEVVVEEPWSLGRLSAVARDGDLLKAAANPRGMQGYAVGR